MNKEKICENCGMTTFFICHTEDWESPLYWCPHCGTIEYNPNSGWGPWSISVPRVPQLAKQRRK